MVARTGYDDEGGRCVWSEGCLAAVFPSWMDRMVQRRLREALADWSGEMTAEALDRGWTAGEKKREEEARTETRVIELMSRSELTEEEEEEVGQLTDW